MTDPKNQYRNKVTGQYSYFGGFDRICVCGHTLGIHCAGGFDCFAGQDGFKTNPESAGMTEPCDCQKFRQSRKKRP